MIPSYFEIEILAIRDEFVTQGHKGLTLLTYPHAEAAATYPLLFFQQLLQKA